MTVKLLMLVIFFAIMLGVGFYSRRHATNVNDFVLGGRGVGPWLTAFAYGTSYFSAVVFIGYAGQFGWKYGLASTWIGIGNALIGSLLAWVILGRRTRVMSKHLSSATMPEFFGSRFHSQGMKIVASLIIFVFLIPYTASVYNGLSRLFGMAFDIPYSVCVMGMAILTAVYVILGGYMATAINDFIQGIIMLAGIAAIILSVLSGQGGPGYPGPARSLHFLFWTGSPEPAGRGDSHLPWNLGPAPDDSQILYHPKRKSHCHGHGDFHPVCHCHLRGQLFPGRLRPAL